MPVAVAGLLAVAGGAALVLRLVRSALRLALSAAETTAAAELADVSARRGDLTGMMERRSAETGARRARRVALALTLLWVAWIVIPLYAGWVREAYALAAVLWLAPRSLKPARRTPTDIPAPPGPA